MDTACYAKLDVETESIAAFVPGINVSHHQPSIDWPTLVRAGFQYCFIKATEGVANVDRSFTRHWDDSRRAGLIRGAYHLFHPGVPVQPQTALFLRALPPPQPGDLPPVLVLETPQDWAPIPSADRSALVLRWLEAVERHCGIRPIVYLSPAFASEILKNPPALADYPVWLAHYTGAETPLIPKPWKSWTFWQYANARTPGITVPVDLNRFHGSREHLKAITLGAPAGTA